MEHRLYRLRFRSKLAQDVFLSVPVNPDKGKEMAMAEAIGRAWCNQDPGRKYIIVEDAIVADETILPVEVEDEPVKRGPGRPPKAAIQ